MVLDTTSDSKLSAVHSYLPLSVVETSFRTISDPAWSNSANNNNNDDDDDDDDDDHDDDDNNNNNSILLRHQAIHIQKAL